MLSNFFWLLHFCISPCRAPKRELYERRASRETFFTPPITRAQTKKGFWRSGAEPKTRKRACIMRYSLAQILISRHFFPLAAAPFPRIRLSRRQAEKNAFNGGDKENRKSPPLNKGSPLLQSLFFPKKKRDCSYMELICEANPQGALAEGAPSFFFLKKEGARHSTSAYRLRCACADAATPPRVPRFKGGVAAGRTHTFSIGRCE